MEWTEELGYHDTQPFSLASTKLVLLFENALASTKFGSELGSMRIEAFTEKSPGVLVDFYLEFRGLLFNISTLDLREGVLLGLKEKAGRYYLGDLELNRDRVDFYVVSTYVPEVDTRVEVLDVFLPDWAWVVIFGGALSVCIIALLGCTVGCNRYVYIAVHYSTLLRYSVLNYDFVLIENRTKEFTLFSSDVDPD